MVFLKHPILFRKSAEEAVSSPLWGTAQDDYNRVADFYRQVHGEEPPVSFSEVAHLAEPPLETAKRIRDDAEWIGEYLSQPYLNPPLTPASKSTVSFYKKRLRELQVEYSRCIQEAENA